MTEDEKPITDAETRKKIQELLERLSTRRGSRQERYAMMSDRIKALRLRGVPRDRWIYREDENPYVDPTEDEIPF